MDRHVARSLIEDELRRLRRLAYPELTALIGKSVHKEVLGSDGKNYQLEIDAVWDNQPNANLRVFLAVDDGGWSAFKPLLGSFIMRPDGSFVGE
jgi:hypothetical protein